MRIPIPRPRNILGALLIAALIVAGALLIAQDQETLRVRTSLAAGNAQFPEYLARLLGAPPTSGDSYIVHSEGTVAFAAMLGAIGRARHRVSFETYVYDSGEVADRFTAAFEAAARRGVDVRLVLDSVGANAIERDHIERLERAGCRIAWFNRLSGFSLEELNYRTHRKSLIVDGDVAFVGGIGIADQWAMDTEAEPRWRDTQKGALVREWHVELINDNVVEHGRGVARRNSLDLSDEIPKSFPIQEQPEAFRIR